MIKTLYHDQHEIADAYEKIMALEKAKIISKYTLPENPSSDGNYHIYVKDETKKSGRRQLKAKTLDELMNKIYEFEKGVFGSHPKTFKESFERWQLEKLKYIKNPEKLLSAKNTIEVVKSQYRKYFSGTAFENKAVDSITKNDIEDLCFDILDKNDVTKKCFLGIRGIIKNTLQYAYNQYWIVDNPYDRIDFKKYKDMLKTSAPISERVHTDEECDRMMGYIHEYQEKNPSYIPAYALELQMMMGLRRGEVPPLRWIDIKNDFISISREQITVKKSPSNPKEYFKIVEHTKTYTDRVFPITKDIREFLNVLKKVQEKYYPESKFLFPDPSMSEGVINNNVVYRFYSRMCKNLGIKISREVMKGTHSFRRNSITKVTNSSGGDLVMAAKLFGNSPDVINKHYYSGMDLEHARKILEA